MRSKPFRAWVQKGSVKGNLEGLQIFFGFCFQSLLGFVSQSRYFAPFRLPCGDLGLRLGFFNVIKGQPTVN